MTILVTGGAGYIGSHTVKALKQRGHTVIVFDSLENGHESAVATELRIGNLLDKTTIERVLKEFSFDAVIHFAAYIEAGESVKDPAKFFENNTAGSINLIRVMLENGVSNLVFSSTAAVYGEPQSTPIKESDPKTPKNPYGTSKWLVEQAITDLTQFTTLKATVLRYFNACGADIEGELGENHHPETHLIPLVLQVAAGKRDAIKIFGTDYPTPDGTAVRDYIHVTDLAEAHVAALEGQTNSPEKLLTFNVGTGQGYSVKEIINTCREVTGHTIPAPHEARRPGDPAILVADSTLIQEKLGWRPKHSSLKTIIQTAWDWHQAHPNGYSD